MAADNTAIPNSDLSKSLIQKGSTNLGDRGTSDMAEFYEDEPLKGMASVNVLIDVKSTKWLNHAAQTTGYSFDDLVTNAAEEAALNYAKENNLLNYKMENAT